MIRPSTASVHTWTNDGGAPKPAGVVEPVL
jgi:hypothetical protein